MRLRSLSRCLTDFYCICTCDTADMAYGPPISSTMITYLTQWLKLASGDRVHLAQRGSLGLSDFFVFKCTCGDNWHVGAENFKGTGVPQVLEDWVKKHRHVCTKYTNTHGVSAGKCSMCGWPYGAHEDSWIKNPAPLWDMKVQTYENSPAPSSPHKQKPMQIFKGRKFRDSDEGV